MDIVMKKLIDAGFEYLKGRVRWPKDMEVELKRLDDIHPKIQAVVAFASTQVQITDPKIQALNKWLWQLRDAIDEADDVFDYFEYMKHKEQLEETQVRCIICHLVDCALKKGKSAVKFGLRALNIDPDLKRLEAAVKKLDEISAGVGPFFLLVKGEKKEQQKQLEELIRERETGSMTTNDQIGQICRAKEKDFVLQWLRKPSNELQTHTTDSNSHNNISLLSIVGHGGMGKTTLCNISIKKK